MNTRHTHTDSKAHRHRNSRVANPSRVTPGRYAISVGHDLHGNDRVDIKVAP
jgi:hypothetical protein